MIDLALCARGVNYAVGTNHILANVSLDVPFGRVLALVGPNGAGKSSLLGVLSGDTTPHSGAVWVEGRKLQEWHARELARHRAVLLQANQVAFSFTAGQVVEMGRAPWIGTPEAELDEIAIADAITQADVAGLLDRAFPTLSGGERARVSLARVLAQATPIVLLDEPTAALDIGHQEVVLRISQALARAGRAVVVVLHDLSLAAAYADDVAIMQHGYLVAHGTPAEVLTAERIEDVYETPVRVIPDPGTGLPLIIPRRD